MAHGEDKWQTQCLNPLANLRRQKLSFDSF
jgi:hypothetical protein